MATKKTKPTRTIARGQRKRHNTHQGPEAVARAEAVKDCLELRAAGHSYRTIAAMRGEPLQTVYDRVRRALADIPKEAADELRAIELERLDLSHQRLEEAASRGDARAIAEQRLIGESRRRLVGLDAPSESRVKFDMPDDPEQLQGLLLTKLRADVQAQEGEGGRSSAPCGGQDGPAAHPGQVDPGPLPGDPVGG